MYWSDDGFFARCCVLSLHSVLAESVFFARLVAAAASEWVSENKSDNGFSEWHSNGLKLIYLFKVDIIALDSACLYSPLVILISKYILFFLLLLLISLLLSHWRRKKPQCMPVPELWECVLVFASASMCQWWWVLAILALYAWYANRNLKSLCMYTITAHMLFLSSPLR